MLTASDLVALLQRTTDHQGWLDPILADPDGGTALGASIAMMARAAAAVAYDSAAAAIGTAPGGAPGTTVLSLARAASGTSGTIPQGYLFVDPRGVQLFVSAPVSVASGATTLSIPLSTFRQTEMVNTEDDPDLEVDPDAGIALDSLGTTPLLAPPGTMSIVATTFLPGVAAQILGGETDWLSVIGKERDQQRQAGEPTESYRARVKSIPDAVSPIAVADAVIGAASRLGIAAMILEPFNDGASSALKIQYGLGTFSALFWSSTNTAGTAAAAAVSPGKDFFDDSGDGRQLVDRRTATAYFRVVLENALVDAAGDEMFWDNAFYDDPVLGYPDVGTPPSVNAQVNAIWEEANRKKAGGVSFDVESDVSTVERGSGYTTANTETVVFTIAPASGKAWLLLDAVLGHDSAFATFPPGALVPAGAYHRLSYTTVDGTVFETPAFSGLGSEELTPDRLSALGAARGPIVSVRGIVKSDGTVPVNLVLALYVAEMTLP
jgi:hypothetical protein